MFKQRERGSTPSGLSAEDQAMPKPLGIQVPDFHESMRLAGVKDVQIPSEAAPANRQTRVLCCCGSPGCSIGPMSKVVEE